MTILPFILAYNNCSRCQQACYCSAQCQAKHWNVHHMHCVPRPSDSPSSRAPSPVDTQSFRALILPAHSTAHQLRMIDVHIFASGADGPRLVPQFSPELGLGDQPDHEICLTDVGGSQLSFPYQIFFRRSFRTDGSPINMCVRALHPEIVYPWAGNLVIFKYNGSRRQMYRHIDLSDLPQIVQFLRTYARY